LSFIHTDAGDTTINAAVLGLRCRVFDWLQVVGNLPILDLRGKERLACEEGERNVRYNSSGVGDANVMGWLALSHLLAGEEECDVEAPEDEEQEEVEGFLDGIGAPSFLFGAGVKFATGECAERSRDKYYADRYRARYTGERSISDGAVPAHQQLGTGSTDLLLGVAYQQSFWGFVGDASFTFQHAGDENTIGYERGDRVFWNVGVKYTLHRAEDCRELYVRGGISGLRIIEPDVDHSEDTTLLGPQEVGDVADTEGTYNFYGVSLRYDITDRLSLDVGFQLPLGTNNRDSDNSFKWQCSLTLLYNF
jgi:hypothetical protein